MWFPYGTRSLQGFPPTMPRRAVLDPVDFAFAEVLAVCEIRAAVCCWVKSHTKPSVPHIVQFLTMKSAVGCEADLRKSTQLSNFQTVRRILTPSSCFTTHIALRYIDTKYSQSSFHSIALSPCSRR